MICTSPVYLQPSIPWFQLPLPTLYGYVCCLSLAECQSWEDRWWPHRGLVLLASVSVWTEIPGLASHWLEQGDGKFCLYVFYISNYSSAWNGPSSDSMWLHLISECPKTVMLPLNGPRAVLIDTKLSITMLDNVELCFDFNTYVSMLQNKITM
jgi:hypothetical protein